MKLQCNLVELHAEFTLLNPLYGTSHILRFSQIEVFGNPVLRKYIGIIFQMVFAHFLSLSRILVILIRFQTFSLLFVIVTSDFTIVTGESIRWHT